MLSRRVGSALAGFVATPERVFVVSPISTFVGSSHSALNCGASIVFGLLITFVGSRFSTLVAPRPRVSWPAPPRSNADIPHTHLS